jgi:hypothetical protein
LSTYTYDLRRSRQSLPKAVVVPERGLENEHVRVVGDPVGGAGVAAGVPAPAHLGPGVRLLDRLADIHTGPRNIKIFDAVMLESTAKKDIIMK